MGDGGLTYCRTLKPETRGSHPDPHEWLSLVNKSGFSNKVNVFCLQVTVDLFHCGLIFEIGNG